MDLPLKSLLLKSFKYEPEQWEYNAVDNLLRSAGIDSDYWKWNARFWLAEFASCGLIEVVDLDLDDGKYFENGKVLSKYKITSLGLSRIETMLED